ncbi:hypothetical protein OsI_21365 [Oryza sativa Indica Group]|uniref:Uncharacterized protein n=1 Tax=Oryza sativa subsp. indica TaxID=39946 RepID=A2Y8I5_ORYSI|nr:hypothetical protein OsI_21365 [Oryza sativa Indica Group]
MSEQPLPQPRSSMREALEKEDKEKAAAAKEKAAVPKNGGNGGGGKNGGGNGGGNGGAGAQPGEETTREIQVVREAYRREPAAPAYVMPEEPPAMVELVGWYLYGFCSYFITHLLLPVLFPAIITQVAFPASDFTPDNKYIVKGANCSIHEMSM